MEHSGAGVETTKTQFASCRGLGVALLVRVPTGEYHFVARALDMGAMVPMVETAEEVARIVSYANYPPYGKRGAAFGVAHDDYLPGSPADKMAASRQRNLVIWPDRNDESLANVDEIAAIDGIDIIWVGHFDLTNSLGIPGQFSHPDYIAGIEKAVAAALRNNKPAGFMALDEKWAAEYWALDFDIIACGLDHLVYQQALARGLDLLGNLRATGC